jgi:hypothetical protein
MNRRVDFKTAELIDIALLTKAAFGPDTAYLYLQLRGLDTALMRKMLDVPAHDLRARLTFASSASEGRRARRRD